MTTNNFQVAEIQKRVESLENEAKSIQSQIDEVCPIFVVCFQIFAISLLHVVTVLFFFHLSVQK